MSAKNEINIAGPVNKPEALLDALPGGGGGAQENFFVGLSISGSDDMEALGFSHLHLEDALTETVRYLLVNDYYLLYGGDLRKNGFTHQLGDLARLYTQWSVEKGIRIRCISTEKASTETKALFRAMGMLLETFTPPDEKEVFGHPLPGAVISRLKSARALVSMRKELTAKTRARVVMGGRLSGYAGRMPGIVEEALYALQQKKALYLCGAMGGAARSVICALTEGRAPYLSEDWQAMQPGYGDFLAAWNSRYPESKTDYRAIVREFHQAGISGLSNNNGLTEEENLRLFNTPHPQEMIFLILKGLGRIREKPENSGYNTV